MNFGPPNEPLQWDGKFAPKAGGPPTPVDEEGRPILSLGANSSGNLRQAMKDRQAASNTRRVMMILLALVPLALGGVGGSLFFDKPFPTAMTCIKSASVAVFITAMLGGCIFCAIMMQLMRLGGFSPVSLLSLFLAPFVGVFLLQVSAGNATESRDPTPAAITLTIIFTILFSPLIAVIARSLGDSTKWQPSGWSQVIGCIIGAVVGAILIRLYCWLKPPPQLATNHSR